MLVSVVQFYRQDTYAGNEDDGVRRVNEFVEAFGKSIYEYKLHGAFAVAACGILINLVIILAHFDSVVFPDFWKKLFQDGSKGERNLLLGLIAFWIGGLFLCTSTLSVGSAQPNVYFTTWIAFVSNVMNFGLWRISSGKTSWDELLHSKRQTSFNWFWTMIFAVISSCGASDLYANRYHVANQFETENFGADLKLALILFWMSVVICFAALAGNCYLTKEFSVACCQKFETIFAWRQVEVILILGMFGLYGWVIFSQLSVYNEPSNVYFGVWGTFFSSIFTFGTWLKETTRFKLSRDARSPVRISGQPAETP